MFQHLTPRPSQLLILLSSQVSVLPHFLVQSQLLFPQQLRVRSRPNLLQLRLQRIRVRLPPQCQPPLLSLLRMFLAEHQLIHLLLLQLHRQVDHPHNQRDSQLVNQVVTLLGSHLRIPPIQPVSLLRTQQTRLLGLPENQVLNLVVNQLLIQRIQQVNRVHLQRLNHHLTQPILSTMWISRI